MPIPRNESSSLVSTFRDASSSRCRTSSGSDSAGSRSSSRPKRTPSGMSRKSSATESTPIASSISRRSASVAESWLTVPAPAPAKPVPPLPEAAPSSPRRSLLCQVLLVGVHVEERVDLGGVGEPDPDEPALSVRVRVHGLGDVDHLLVHLDDLARERRDHIRDGLHGLDLAVGGVLRGRPALRRRLEVDELTECVLREPGHAERRLVPVDP